MLLIFDLFKFISFWRNLILLFFTFLMILLISFGACQVVLVIKNLSVSVGDIRDPGSIPGLGKSSGGGNGNPLQYTCLENPMDRRAQRGYSPWGRKELDRAEQLTLPLFSPTGKYVQCLVITSKGKEFKE